MLSKVQRGVRTPTRTRRRKADHWRQHVVHVLGGPEQVPPLVFVALGALALGALFLAPGFNLQDKRVETLLVIATTVLLAGLIQVLTAFVRWWSMGGERAEFYRFFGCGDIIGVVPDLASKELTVGWDPPGSNGARPKGTRVIPFQDLRAAISLAELFEEFEVPFKIVIDTPYNDGTPPLCGFVAIGLGFNKLTCMLSSVSELFEIRYVETETGERKDDFRFDGSDHRAPTDLIDYALIVRAPLLINGQLISAFVCAGRTASGTAAAGYFLKNRWTELYDLYRANGKRFDDDTLAVELEYKPNAIVMARIGRHQFREQSVVLPRPAQAVIPTRFVPAVRGDFAERFEPAMATQDESTMSDDAPFSEVGERR